MKLSQYILSILTFFGLAFCLIGCSDELELDISYKNDISYHYNEDGTLNVGISFEAGNMMTAATRGMGNDPQYEDLDLFVLVIEKSTQKILQSKKAVKVTNNETDVLHGRPWQHFNVTLNPTATPAVVHLIASNQPDLNLQLGVIGSAALLRTIHTKDKKEAYWARIDLNEAIPGTNNDTDGSRAQGIADKLSHVPMVRNFCRVSAESQVEDFIIDELYLVNANDRGAVVPYLITDAQSDETKGRLGFVQFFNIDKTNNKAVARAYDEIDPAYIGEPPSGTTQLAYDLTSEYSEVRKQHEIYFYERPFRKDNRTFVVVKGRRGENLEPRYYKVDLGKVEATSEYGEFVYYNLIRNFDYHIIINGVTSNGFATLDEAKSQNSYVSNNLSSTVETRDLTWVQEGGDAIFVNKTKFIVTGSKAAELFEVRGRYISRDESESDQLKIMIEGYEKGFLEFENGGTVKDGNKILGAGTVSDDWVSWNLKIRDGYQIPEEAVQQTVVVYRGNKNEGSGNPDFGLYRKITFTFIRDFIIEKIDTFPGDYDEDDYYKNITWPADEEDDEGNTTAGHITRKIGEGIGAPLALFFKLEDNLPSSIFPLDFTIESDRQNIQNAYAGNAVVNTVPPSGSLFFNEDVYNVTTARIQFIKTVTYDDYINCKGIVRARFLTTTSLGQDYGIKVGDGADAYYESKTRLKVFNEYFNIAYDDFFRRSTEAPPVVQADFNDTNAWSTFYSYLSTDGRDRLSSHIIYNGNPTSLRFHEEQAGNLINISQTITSEFPPTTFIRTATTGEYFQYEFTQPDGQEKTIRVEVMSGTIHQNDIWGTSYYTVTGERPIISCNGLSFSGPIENTGSPTTTYVYTATIPASNEAESYTLRIYPSVENQCFFKINIYPAYDGN